VKITDGVDAGCYAYSDLFTIGELCGFAITNPYSSSSWTVGEARTILWNHTDGTGNVNIELYKGPALQCAIASPTPNDGSYAWTVDDCAGGTSSEYRVRISDAVDGNCSAYSSTFTITVP
jgi:hypothetical protein